MLFAEDVPSSVAYVPPKLYQARTPFEKFKLAISGYKNTGERNQFGKAASWLPTYSIYSDILAGSMFNRKSSPDSYNNFKMTEQRDAQKGLTYLEAGASAAAFAAGNPQLGFSLGSSALGSGLSLKNKPQYNTEGEYIPQRNYGSYKHGGDITSASEVYDFNADEISALKTLGYKIEIL